MTRLIWTSLLEKLTIYLLDSLSLINIILKSFLNKSNLIWLQPFLSGKVWFFFNLETIAKKFHGNPSVVRGKYLRCLDYYDRCINIFSFQKTRIFGRELTRIIPNSTSLYRNRSGVKKIVKSAIAKGYTDVLIVNEHRKEPDGLLVIHLPNGPTAHFRVSNVRITTELRKIIRISQLTGLKLSSIIFRLG